MFGFVMGFVVREEAERERLLRDVEMATEGLRPGSDLMGIAAARGCGCVFLKGGTLRFTLPCHDFCGYQRRS